MEIEDAERGAAEPSLGSSTSIRDPRCLYYPGAQLLAVLFQAPPPQESWELDRQREQRHMGFPHLSSQVKHTTFLEESDSLGPNLSPVTF